VDVNHHHHHFLCDGESVYVLSPATVTEKQNVPIDVYNVWMLDLREFNLRWKKLPSLPRLGEEYNIYASICVGERYIWQRRRTLSSEADGCVRDLTSLTPHVGRIIFFYVIKG
jgi:hypothetical protein